MSDGIVKRWIFCCVASHSTSVPHVSVIGTILTSNELTKIDFSNVFPSSNVVTKFQFVNHVIDLEKTRK